VLLDVLFSTAQGDLFDKPQSEAFKRETGEIFAILDRAPPDDDGGSATRHGFRRRVYNARRLLLLNDSDSSSLLKKEVKAATGGLVAAEQISDSGDCGLGSASGGLHLKALYENVSQRNTRRALKLCVEAHAAGARDAQGDGDLAKAQSLINDALYNNNMGVLHSSLDKPMLAVLYYQKALAIVTAEGAASAFDAETGAFLQFPVCEVLHNSALACISAKQFAMAYECMATCLSRTEEGAGRDVFESRASCWLRAGDALLGVWGDLFKAAGGGVAANLFGWQHYVCTLKRDLSSVEARRHAHLGSEDDLVEVVQDPLSRALYCYERAVELTGGDVQHHCFLPACLNLAFVYLEVRNWSKALSYSTTVLERGGGGRGGGAAAAASEAGGDDDDRGEVMKDEYMQETARAYHTEASFMAANDKA
jgi:hypothetical protein